MITQKCLIPATMPPPQEAFVPKKDLELADK